MPYKTREERVNYLKNYRKKWKEEGKCVRCGGTRTDMRITCNFCATRENGYVRNTVEKNLSNGRCRCGKERIQNKLVCQSCSETSARTLRELKLKVMAGYGNRCACCEESLIEFLSVDHVIERGCDERRRLGKKMNSGTFYRKIIRENFPAEYQILCFNCNMSLGFFGYCPHHPKIRRPIAKS